MAKFLGYSVNPDVEAYAAVMRRRWPWMTRSTIAQLGWIGDACRCIASIRWEAERLRYPWVEGPMATMRVYAGWLDEIVRAEPWAHEASGGPEARVPSRRTWS